MAILITVHGVACRGHHITVPRASIGKASLNLVHLLSIVVPGFRV